jgi:tRNA (guanine37-N1)-methyltransferase
VSPSERARGLRVSRERGERTRKKLIAEGHLRTDLAILREEGFLVLPLREGASVDPLSGTIVESEFPIVAPPRHGDYRELLDWPSDLRDQLPRAFDVVGDIVLVRLPDSLASRSAEIGAALLEFVPGARIVGQDLGVHGRDRLRRILRIAGSGGWRTRHRENELEFDVDVERAYYSPRLAREHRMVAEAVEDGERIADLCCGIGPFALTIARTGRAREITAVDANPVAIELLEATRRRYRFGDTVRPVCGELESFLPGVEPFDRVILNLPHEGYKYAPSVAQAVAPRGRFQYYEVAPRAELDRRSEWLMRSLGTNSWRVADRHIVHPYSPGADLVAYRFERLPE